MLQQITDNILAELTTSGIHHQTMLLLSTISIYCQTVSIACSPSVILHRVSLASIITTHPRYASVCVVMSYSDFKYSWPLCASFFHSYRYQDTLIILSSCTPSYLTFLMAALVAFSDIPVRWSFSGLHHFCQVSLYCVHFFRF